MIGPQLPPGHKPAGQNGASAAPPPQVPLVSVTDLTFMVKADMGAGLQNLGNSCYMNSVLQCLAYLPPLTSALQQHRLHGFASPCPLKNKGALCAACVVENQLLSQLNNPSGRAVRPEGLHYKLQMFSKSFVRGRQEDAHEFLLGVMDAVERDSRRGLVMLRHPKATRTLIEQLFCGRLQSQVRCLECGHCSNTYETLTSLSLDLQRITSVEQSMAQYTASELLDGANKYKCDKCMRLVPARKSLGVHDEPNALVIHLKRFDAFSFSAKVGKHIEFKPTLSLPDPPGPGPTANGSTSANGNGSNGSHGPSHANGSGGTYGPMPANGHAQHGGGAHGPSQANGHSGHASRAVYMLTGVVVHSGGSVHSGHYYAYVRNSSGKWFCANDSSVYPVQLSEVLQQQAYLLFYARTRLKPLGPPPDAPPAAAPATHGPVGAAPALAKAPSGSAPLATARSQPLATVHSQPLAGTPTTSPRAPIGPQRPPPRLEPHHSHPHSGPQAALPRAASNPSGSWTTVSNGGPYDASQPTQPPRSGATGSWSAAGPQAAHAPVTHPPAKTLTTTMTGLSGNVPRIVLKPKAAPGAKPPWDPQAAHAQLARNNSQQPTNPAGPSDTLQRQPSQQQQQQPHSGEHGSEAAPESGARTETESRKRARSKASPGEQAGEAEQGAAKRVARSSSHAEAQEPTALREALQHTYDQLFAAISAAPGCRDELRALCLRLKEQGLSLKQVLAQDPAGRNAIIRSWLQAQGGRMMQDLREQLEAVVRATMKPAKA